MVVLPSVGVNCSVCGCPILKYNRRIQLVDSKPESWGDGHSTATVHILGAGVCCSWACVAAYVAVQAADPVAV